MKPTYEDLERQILELEKQLLARGEEPQTLKRPNANPAAPGSEQAVEAWRLNERRLFLAISATADAIWEWNVATDETYYSPRWYEMLGYEDRKFPMSFETWKQLCHPDDFQPALDRLQTMLHTDSRSGYETEFRMRAADGSWKWIRGRGNVVERNAEGDPILLSGTNTDITEPKQVLEALQASEERLRLAMQAARQGWFDVNVQTGEVWVSPEYPRMIGYDPAEFDTSLQNWIDNIRPEDRPLVLEAYRNCLETGRVGTMDYRRRTKAGDWKWIRSIGKVVASDAEGKPLRMTGIHADISEQKRAEHALGASEERFRSLVETVSDWIWETDARGVYTYASPRVRDLLGYEPSEVVGKMPFELMTPEEARRLAPLVNRCFERAEPISGLENWCLHKDGREVLLETSGTPLFDAGGNFAGFSGIDRDITERKRAQDELHRLRNYLGNIINSMPSVLVGVDAGGAVTQWNRQAESQSGLSEAQVLGRRLDEVFPPLAEKTELIRSAMTERRVVTDSRKTTLPGGETRYEELTVYPLTAEGIEGAVIRVDDVSGKMLFQEMLVESEKMLSVGGLAAGMAHEINTPLGAILQAAQLIGQRVSPDLEANARAAGECGTSLSAVRNYLEQRSVFLLLEGIRLSGQRAAEIVANMLSFSRKPDEAGSAENLAALLDRTLVLAADEYSLRKHCDFRQIEIRREYQANIPPVVCQASRIQQVILNILRNGAEAMSEKKLLLEGNPELEKGWRPRFILRLMAEPAAGMVRMEIADNGPGMDEATRRHVFEPFFTTKPPDVGTGLGLSVSYFIVTQNHGGEIRVESAPGRGSTFIIRLPMTRRP